MKFYLFNFDNVEVNDPSELTNEEFKDLAKKDGGFIIDTAEDFEAQFNAEHFSTATHQLRIVENDNSDRERKIAIIKRIIQVWGATSSCELELDGSPCLVSNGSNKNNFSQLIEDFNDTHVVVYSYHNETELNHFEIPYEDLREDLIDEIHQIMLDYEEDQEVENE